MFHVRLEMDIPCIGANGVTERVKLVGDPAASATEALENMSQIIIAREHALCTHEGTGREAF
jgi:hypothetical protein